MIEDIINIIISYCNFCTLCGKNHLEYCKIYSLCEDCSWKTIPIRSYNNIFKYMNGMSALTYSS